MSYSRSVLFALIFSFGYSSPSFAEAIRLVNGTTGTNVAWLDGGNLALCQAGSSLDWVAAASAVVRYGFDGTEVGTFTVGAGHDYTVLLGASGISVVDESPRHTYYFWLGFSFFTMAGLVSVAGRWVSQILGGGVNE